MSDQITVVGTVASVPERRQTGTGTVIANFRLATNVRRRDDATGAWVDGHTNWYSVSAYRGLAEHVLESVQKGQRVIVVGGFKLRPWEAGDRHGIAAEIDAVSLGHDLLWGTTVYRRDERTGSPGAAGSGASAPAGAPVPAPSPAAHEPDHSGSWAPVLLDEATPF